MARKLGLMFSGAVLIMIFLVWMLFKGTDVVRSWIEANQVLGLVAWGAAWLCLLGGAALVVRALFPQRREPVAEGE
ncbi:hypothetical protein ACLKM7_09605 [Microbacterium sp. I2]|uniref:hypothetical protein n=1 Tax=Microbacterium sp. I2 TaxID=3391826 RepID=UPI003EDAC675